MQKLKETLSK